MHVIDLPAADAIYHHSCSMNFLTHKQIPQTSPQVEHVKRQMGRPEEDKRTDTFFKVLDFLKENDDKQLTVQELLDKMSDHLGGTGQ